MRALPKWLCVFLCAAAACAQPRIEHGKAGAADGFDVVAFTLSGLSELPEQFSGLCITNMALMRTMTVDRRGGDSCNFTVRPDTPGVFGVVVDTGKGLSFKASDALLDAVEVAPERVRAVARPADDLRDYWERVRLQIDYLTDNPRLKLVYDGTADGRKLAPIRFDDTVKTEALPEGVEIYSFAIDAGFSDSPLDSPAGIRAVGYMVKPKGTGPFPVVITYHASGIIHAPLEEALFFARHGAMAFTVNPHPVSNETSSEERQRLLNETLRDYRTIGVDGKREEIYFNGMYQRAYQVVQAVLQSPLWDKKHLVVRGFSQGGAQAIMAAYWCPQVTALSLQCPAMCDLAGSLEGRAPSWPYWLLGKTRESNAFENARTFDLVNLAPYIRADMIVGIGAFDRLCPATSQLAFFNAYGGKKARLFRPQCGHGLDEGWGVFERAFLARHLGISFSASPTASPSAEAQAR